MEGLLKVGFRFRDQGTLQLGLDLAHKESGWRMTMHST